MLKMNIFFLFVNVSFVDLYSIVEQTKSFSRGKFFMRILVFRPTITQRSKSETLQNTKDIDFQSF